VSRRTVAACVSSSLAFAFALVLVAAAAVETTSRLAASCRWIAATVSEPPAPPPAIPERAVALRARLVEVGGRPGTPDPELRSIAPLFRPPLAAFRSFEVVDDATVLLVRGRPVRRIFGDALEVSVALVGGNDGAPEVTVDLHDGRGAIRARMATDLVIASSSNGRVLLTVLSLLPPPPSSWPSSSSGTRTPVEQSVVNSRAELRMSAR
jgi:hypothetical protein